jgi:hypothetical protein
MCLNFNGLGKCWVRREFHQLTRIFWAANGFPFPSHPGRRRWKRPLRTLRRICRPPQTIAGNEVIWTNPEGIESSSPGLAGSAGLPWVIVSTNMTYPAGMNDGWQIDRVYARAIKWGQAVPTPAGFHIPSILLLNRAPARRSSQPTPGSA